MRSSRECGSAVNYRVVAKTAANSLACRNTLLSWHSGIRVSARARARVCVHACVCTLCRKHLLERFASAAHYDRCFVGSRIDEAVLFH